MAIFRVSTISSLLLGTALSLGACSSESKLPTDLDSQTAPGKNDNAQDLVDWEDVNEPLFSSNLRGQLCKSISDANSAVDCADLEYTVTKIGRSNFLQFASDSGPVTVQLDVRADHMPSGTFFDTKLKRVLVDYDLQFAVEIVGGDLQSDKDFVDALADEGGERPDFDAWIASGKIAKTASSDLPVDIMDTFESALAEHIEGVTGGDPNSTDGAFFDDNAGPFFQIMDGSRVRGYILTIHDDIDHPLWDGSGSTYYYDSLGSEVEIANWAG